VATGDLTTLANAKQWMNVSTTTDDALITRLVSAASQFVQKYIHRQIAVAPYTDVRNGNDQWEMVLANWPIVSVTSVTVNGNVIAAAPAMVPGGVPTVGYLNDEETVYLYGSRFYRGVQNVQIVYEAGYAETPIEIEQAVIELIALKYTGRQHMGQNSKSIQGEVISYFTGDMPRETQTMLNQYKKVMPVS
jgi:hypothetical protein